LQWLEGFTAARRRIARTYFADISNPRISLLVPPDDEANHVHHLFVVLADERDRLALHLKDRGIQSLIHYPVPVHHQLPCLGLARDPYGLPHAEAHAARCLSLPCHPYLSDADLAYVIEAVNDFS
jgi:dTDP-4-amino-4,6-dideoxygalactose transaminase